MNLLLRICRIISYIIIYYLVMILVLFIASVIIPYIPWFEPLTNSVAMAAGGIMLALLLPYTKLSAGKKKGCGWMIGSVAAIAVGSSVLLNIAMGLIPWERIPGSYVVQNSEVMFSIPFWVCILNYVIIAPLVEELLFRGCIFGDLKEIMPVWGAILLSAVFFGVYHGNLQQGIYAFLCGVILAVIYQLTDSFWMPVLFHALANLISTVSYEYNKIGEMLGNPVSLVILSVIMLAGIATFIYYYKKTLSQKEG